MSTTRPSWYGRGVSESETNGAADPAVDATERIGERLAHLRAARNLKISDLARRISVSPSLISQIERGQSRPSVTTLFALAQQLEVPVDAFFETQPLTPLMPPPADKPATGPGNGAEAGAGASREQAESQTLWADSSVGGWDAGGGYLLKHDERPTVDIQGDVRWERLTRTALKDLEFLELVYQPGAESGAQLYRHPGLECVLVTENRLDITIGFEVNQVMAGDSIAFPSSLPHRYTNPTDQVSRAVTVILRDGMSSLQGMATSADTAVE